MNVGDKVTWTNSMSRNGRIGFSTRSGRIMQLLPNSAWVKMRNGNLVNLALTQLRKEGEKTEVQEMFEQLAGPKSKEAK